VVTSPILVEIISAAWGDDKERSVSVSAVLGKGLDVFPFCTFMSQEEFAIRFRSLFVAKKGDDFDYVAQYASKLVGGMNVEGADDGVTQRVAVRRGICESRTDKMELKAIVKLSPYRTFRDVEQPESEFLLRVRMDSNGMPTVALFEADGGAWRDKAMANIVEYIERQVPGIPVIA